MHAALLALALAPLICAALYCDASDDCTESAALNIKLTYFDVSLGFVDVTHASIDILQGAGRAEAARLAFHIGGIEFVDERLSWEVGERLLPLFIL